MTIHMRLYPDWGPRVLRAQPIGGPYERYARSVAHELQEAAIVVFRIFENKGNQGRVSEFTPPKYVSSFRIKYYRQSFLTRMSNEDPGWHLVEWGAHPGGGDTQVLRYKPLTRALIIVGARNRGR